MSPDRLLCFICITRNEEQTDMCKIIFSNVNPAPQEKTPETRLRPLGHEASRFWMIWKYFDFENWDAKLTGSNQLGRVDYIPRAYCSLNRQHRCCQFDSQDLILIRLQFQTLNRVAIHLSHYSLLYYLFWMKNYQFLLFRFEVSIKWTYCWKVSQFYKMRSSNEPTKHFNHFINQFCEKIMVFKFLDQSIQFL